MKGISRPLWGSRLKKREKLGRAALKKILRDLLPAATQLHAASPFFNFAAVKKKKKKKKMKKKKKNKKKKGRQPRRHSPKYFPDPLPTFFPSPLSLSSFPHLSLSLSLSIGH
jgi:hypothetical protein